MKDIHIPKLVYGYIQIGRMITGQPRQRKNEKTHEKGKASNGEQMIFFILLMLFIFQSIIRLIGNGLTKFEKT